MPLPAETSPPPSSATPTPTRSRYSIWKGGVAATFLSGLFAILPLVLTVVIVGWVAQQVLNIVGPGTQIGSALRSVGLRFVTNAWVAQVIGWAIVLAGIWMLGLLVRTRARVLFDRFIELFIHRIPIVKGVYGTASQVFRMLERTDENELQGMGVVFCDFGREHGAGFLCLLANSDVFYFDNQAYHVVYMPTSPIPMTGGIIFVPADSIRPVQMSVEKLLEVYLSMGVLSPHAIPGTHQKPKS